jgi:hypothetical protein
LLAERPLTGVGRAFARAVTSGAPIAESAADLAREHRATARSTAQAAAQRAGVAAVGPLGACFLPAFVLVAVVPLVVGLAQQVLR